MSVQKQKQDTERHFAAGRGHHYVEHHLWMMAPPWLALGALIVLGAVLHLVLAGHMIRLAWGVFALTLATVVVATIAALAGRARGPMTRGLAVTATALGGVWLIVAAIVGVGHVDLVLAAALIGAVLCLATNLRRLLRGGGTDPGHQPAQDWAGLSDDVKVLRARVQAKRVEGATQKATLQLPPGMTAADAQGNVPALAAALKVPPGGVRVTPDPDDASVVELAVTPEDVLRRTVRWPGPSAPGESIAEPVPFGVHQEGQVAQIHLAGPPGLSLAHILVAGMTGAGKSELIQTIVADAATRCDVEIDYVDVAGKAAQTIGPIRPAIRELVIDKAAGGRYLARLLAEVPDRARMLAQAGMRSWQPGAPVPFRIVVIDEGASLVNESDTFVELARVLRSVGVMLLLAIQRVTHDQMPTSARANFGAVVCFGVRSAADVAKILSPETIDAGAVPESWKATRPGYCYAELPGESAESWATPIRAYLAAPEQVSAAVAAHAPRTDLVVDGEEGEIVDETAAAGDGVDGEIEAAAYRPAARLVDELSRINPDADLADIPGVDMDAPIGERPDRALTAVQADAALDALLDAMRDTGMDQFRRADLIREGALDVTGRSRTWLSDAVRRRLAEGRLVDATGDRSDHLYTWSNGPSNAVHPPIGCAA